MGNSVKQRQLIVNVKFCLWIIASTDFGPVHTYPFSFKKRFFIENVPNPESRFRIVFTRPHDNE